MKVSYNGTVYNVDDLYEVMDNWTLTNAVEESINEIEEPVKILGLEYSAGHALRVLDQVAFRSVVIREMELAIEDLKYELASANVGDTVNLRYAGEVTLVEE